MPRFIPGDHVRPINTNPGLPLDSVWVVHRYNRADGKMALYSLGLADRSSYPPSHVIGRVFSDCDFEMVVKVRGRWNAVNPSTDIIDQLALDEARLDGIANSSSAPDVQSDQKVDQVAVADKLVERAAATLDAAKENARKAREEARAEAKAEAKRKAAAVAAKKAREEHEAVSVRLNKDRDLAAATAALIAELRRLHDGGAEQCAAAIIAMHVDKLQPLAKSYGYKIAKPGAIAVVVRA